MIKHTLRAAGRVLSPGLRCFSGIPGGEITEDVSERAGSPHLTQQASLYVHWPYCLRRCSYCNFNKYIPRTDNNHIMTECLQREVETLLQLSQVSCITSVFLGGGTPSLAHPLTISAILETVSRQANLSDKAEVTLEVNPTPVGMSKLEDFCHAGVNRFSIGVQSLQDEDLKILGRDHSSHQALQTIEEARKLCPGRVSVDVMFGRPKQSVESWEKELSELLRVCDDHVSLYQLTLERGTQLFKQVQCGEVTVPADDVTAEMYQCARRTLHQHGFLQYEVSNFARHNAVSHHNMSYWKGRQYIGVGPGAHGRFVPLGEGGVIREARTQTLEPDIWIREVQQRGQGTRRRIQLSHLELLEEVLVMGMRMTEGITHKHWQLFSPQLGLHEIFGTSTDVQEFLQSGQLILDDRGLRCSWDGLALLDSMLPSLLLELETSILQRPQRDHQADGQTEKTSNPR
ncbi:radical S-adenosyl methionine domain-containing protein 1, mitochondrial [Thunnus maccoyii]|uniref:radical S-adenosyl methionine domain-containing protein 1, mitochondrial n=1 Tax=Thunnus maccoyii TaxID=8240 RepID=UPI001C4D9F5E|nr:radical S-adenosyl methionine domain-containing protein 1, mitochondrial [Thunnus maccoyii]XP_042247964.1 radical S-adenosyl methionine domain-containing protein 1, mitochondrial [Thunnus maccoyii]XP_042247965.1 radical S-adenosyl methionine domain-containing protein 1, mitochondrial [Thunnus maccoyii]